MPALGESVTEGTVTRWLKQVGDTVEADEPLLEVSTDKVDTEIPSPVAGTLLEIKVAEDETVDGRRRARRDRRGRRPAAAHQRRRLRRPPQQAPAAAGARAEAPAPRRRPPQAAAAAGGRRPSPGAAAQASARAPAERRPPDRGRRSRRRPRPQPAAGPRRQRRRDDAGYVTPLVRKLAAEHGVDLSALTGTGVGGRIRKQDVLDAAAARPRRRPGGRRSRPRRPPPPRRPAPAAEAATPEPAARHAPRSCPACARSSPGGWSSRCRSRRS